MNIKIDARLQRILKFLVSGGSAALTEFTVFLLLHIVGHVEIVVANTVSFLCGLVVSFLLNKYWVFQSDKEFGHELVRYFVLAVINLVISNGLIYLLADFTHLPSLVAKLLVMIAIAAWNYVLFSLVIFRDR